MSEFFSVFIKFGGVISINSLCENSKHAQIVN